MASVPDIVSYAAKIYPKLFADYGFTVEPFHGFVPSDNGVFAYTYVDASGRRYLLELTLNFPTVGARNDRLIVDNTMVRDKRRGYESTPLFRWLQDSSSLGA